MLFIVADDDEHDACGHESPLGFYLAHNYGYGSCYIMLLIVDDDDEHNMRVMTHSPGPYSESSQ